MRAIRINQRKTAPRRGTVLILVLVVVVLLSLSAYRFSDGMLTERQVVRATHRSLHLRSAAESGVEAAAAFLEDREARTLEPITGNTRRFQNAVIGELERGQARFTILNTPAERNDRGQYPLERIGLANESARLNLNTLALEPLRRKESRHRLLALPRMTAPIADAILDWMDEDDQPSEYGAESNYYLTQTPPRYPRQSRFESIEELLAVRGVTEELLFGKTAASPSTWKIARPHPSKHRLPSLAFTPTSAPDDQGWANHLTITSREGNLRPDGTPKLNVNHRNLAELYETLRLEFDEETARFVVAWRLAGSIDGDETPEGEPDRDDHSEEANRARIEAAERRAREQLGEAVDADPPSTSQAETRRSGLDLNRPPVFVVKSLLDLIGTKVRIDIDSSEAILKSPWPDDPVSLAQVWRDLDDRLTITSDDVIAGRINVNEAPRLVLLSIPGFTEPLADAILTRRQHSIGTSEITKGHQSLVWLLEEGVVELQQLRRIAAYLTTGGDVYRGTAIGHTDGTGSAISLHFLIDATQSPATVLEMRD